MAIVQRLSEFIDVISLQFELQLTNIKCFYFFKMLNNILMYLMHFRVEMFSSVLLMKRKNIIINCLKDVIKHYSMCIGYLKAIFKVNFIICSNAILSIFILETKFNVTEVGTPEL